MSDKVSFDLSGRQSFPDWLRQQKKIVVPTALLAFFIACAGGFQGVAKIIWGTFARRDLGESGWLFVAYVFDFICVLCNLLLLGVMNAYVRNCRRDAVEWIRDSESKNFDKFWDYWSWLWKVFFLYYCVRAVFYCPYMIGVLHPDPNKAGSFFPVTAPLYVTQGGAPIWWAIDCLGSMLSAIFLYLAYVALFLPETRSCEANVRLNDAEDKQAYDLTHWAITLMLLCIGWVNAMAFTVVKKFDFFSAIVESDNRWYIPAVLVVNFAFAVSIALFVGRLSARHFRIRPTAIGLLYCYAFLQIATGIFDFLMPSEVSKIGSGLCLLLAAVLKWLMFFIVAWLLETQTLGFYLREAKGQIRKIGRRWETYMAEGHVAVVQVSPGKNIKNETEPEEEAEDDAESDEDEAITTNQQGESAHVADGIQDTSLFTVRRIDLK